VKKFKMRHAPGTFTPWFLPDLLTLRAVRSANEYICCVVPGYDEKNNMEGAQHGLFSHLIIILNTFVILHPAPMPGVGWPYHRRRRDNVTSYDRL
jgi:hypothetical protein